MANAVRVEIGVRGRFTRYILLGRFTETSTDVGFLSAAALQATTQNTNLPKGSMAVIFVANSILMIGRPGDSERDYATTLDVDADATRLSLFARVFICSTPKRDCIYRVFIVASKECFTN